MRIAIGSTNKIKIQALEEVLHSYPLMTGFKILPFSVPSLVSDQPLTVDETIRGAKNRARAAFKHCPDCSLGFGIESGLMKVDEAASGYMELTICAIYDGSLFALGQSCGFELPSSVMDLVLQEKLDLGQACLQSGLTSNPLLGAAEGAIGVLTNGRITRKEYTKQALITAMMQIENENLYHVSQNFFMNS